MTSRVVLRERQQWSGSAMVSSGAGAATLIGLDVMKAGGNAFDAAVAVSAALTVTWPMSSGPAGDMAAILHSERRNQTLSLTSLGRAPMAAEIDFFRQRGFATVPRTGLYSSTTPALFDAWVALSESGYCRLSLAGLLEPAIGLATEGIVVSSQFQKWTRDNMAFLDKAFASTYAPAVDADAVGRRLRQPGLAAFLRLAGNLDGEELRGRVGHELSRLHCDGGHYFTAEDMKLPHAEISLAMPRKKLGAWSVHTTPPPTQGILCLQNLALLENLCDRPLDLSTAPNIHVLAEAINHTFGWRLRHLGDPNFVTVPDALKDQTLRQLEAEMDLTMRSPSCVGGWYNLGDTTHFVTADGDGNVVSWVQSLGLGFGAGMGIPDYGMLLCNRLGRSATLVPGQANCCAPHKRPVNTIFPWMCINGDSIVLAGGTPGGDGQCQWNSQVLGAMVLGGLDAVQALSMPRWTLYPGSDKMERGMEPSLKVDDSMSAVTRAQLEGFGHRIVVSANVGGANRILRVGRGHLWALDDGRQEGLTAGR